MKTEPIEITQSRVTAKFIALKKPHAHIFPGKEQDIQLLISGEKEPVTKRFVHYEGKTNESRILGMGEWYEKYEVKAGDYIVIEKIGGSNALYLLSLIRKSRVEVADEFVEYVAPNIEAEEGKELVRQHKIRERKPELAKEKKKQVSQNLGCLKCEVCAFDFAQTYGSWGKEFIECHHIVPISQLVKGQKTKLEDLALVCSNCHRMLHRERDVLSIPDLKRIIESALTSSDDSEN